MAAATLTAKGQIVIPAEVRARCEPTADTRVEFVDDGESIRLLVRRRIAPTDRAAGCERFVTFDDRRPARRAKRLRLEPEVSLLR